MNIHAGTVHDLRIEMAKEILNNSGKQAVVRYL